MEANILQFRKLPSNVRTAEIPIQKLLNVTHEETSISPELLAIRSGAYFIQIFLCRIRCLEIPLKY